MGARSIRAASLAALATALIACLAFGASVLAEPAAAPGDNGHPVQLTFTKWITGTAANGDSLMSGVVGGDVSGTFSGEVLRYQQTTSGDVTRLVAVYEVHAADPRHSFKALVQGGSDNDQPTNKALLDGVVLGGWLTGEKVHVQFLTIQCSPPNPQASGNTCFQGTITVVPGTEKR